MTTTTTMTAEKTKPAQTKVYSPSALRTVRTVQTGHLPTAHTKRIHTSDELREGLWRSPNTTEEHEHTSDTLTSSTKPLFLCTYPHHHNKHQTHRQRQRTVFITTHSGVCAFFYYTQDTNNTLHFGNLRRGQRRCSGALLLL